MAGKKKRQTLEDELAALRAVAADPRTPEAEALLRAGLGSQRSLVAARAALIIKDRRLDGFAPELCAAFDRWLAEPAKADPGCKAKLAVLEALDYTETMDDAPFLAGARCEQLEPAWGAPVDSAAGVRARALLALARIGFTDLPLLAGELLADKELGVRCAAADALAHCGARAGAGLLLFKLAAGDAEPQVTLACMNALLSLAPDWGLRTLAPHLSGAKEEQRELAALALGQSGRGDAADLLIDTLRAEVLPKRREVLLRALGLHRSDKALELLLSTVAEGHAADAKAAVASLGVRRFEPSMPTRVREAAQRNEQVDLREALEKAFPPTEETAAR
jgi:HEAT repeat protein